MEIKYMQDLIDEIKSKRELAALDDDFIETKIRSFFEDIHNYQYKEKINKKLESSTTYRQFKKSREYDYLIKNIRAELRKVYGAFILNEYHKKSKILAKLRKGLSEEEEFEIHEELLSLHKSTNERLSHYKELYFKIFSKIKTKKLVILDIACGLNPISNIYFRDRIEKYYASDISSVDCKFLEEYFAKTDIDSEVFAMDLAEEKNYVRLSKIRCDVCFIFKTLDGIERVKRDITEHLLKAINTEYFAITFPTLSLGGVREIKEYRRLWLERLFERLDWKFDKVLIENELLYFVEKK